MNKKRRPQQQNKDHCTMPRLAFSYKRCSDKPQERGASLKRQDDIPVAMCKKYGWRLDDGLRLLPDVGVSAFHGANAEIGNLSRFLDAIRIGRVPRGAVLIIENLDRLSRNEIGEALSLWLGILHAGVDIATKETLDDLRNLHTRETANDLGRIITIILEMARAHGESVRKSETIGDAWRRKKDAAREKRRPLSYLCPAWLRVIGDRKAEKRCFQLVPERVATIRKIFELASDGWGKLRIAHYLHQHRDQHPAFGRSGKWNERYVERILSDGRVIGRYQPHEYISNRERQPVGETILDYYPAVIAEPLFRAAQAARERNRRINGGRPAKSGDCLWTGIVFNAATGSTMRMAPCDGRQYLSSARQDGHAGPQLRLRLDYFEPAVLELLAQLRARDVVPDAQPITEIEQELAELTAKQERRRQRKVELQALAADPDADQDVADIVAAMNLLASEMKKTDKRRAELHDQARTGRTEALAEMQTLIEQYQATPQANRPDLRRRLRTGIRDWVAEVWVLLQPIRRQCTIAHVQVWFHSGDRPRYACVIPKNADPADAWDLDGEDLRTWQRAGRERGRPLGWREISDATAESALT